MQPTPVDAARFPDRAEVRLSDALRLRLAALSATAAVYEDEVDSLLSLTDLRVSGLITFPSPLLGGLLEDLPEIVQREVLPRLDAAGRASFALVGHACRAGGY